MSVHVAPRGKKWLVRRGGAKKALKLFDTRDEAVTFAETVRSFPICIFSSRGLMERFIVSPQTEAAMKRLAKT